jgi:hypothetical protein
MQQAMCLINSPLGELLVSVDIDLITVTTNLPSLEMPQRCSMNTELKVFLLNATKGSYYKSFHYRLYSRQQEVV